MSSITCCYPLANYPLLIVAMFFGVAIRAFFAALFNRERAEAIRVVLEREDSDQRRLTDVQKPAAAERETVTAPVAGAGRKPAGAVRSEAVTLLATLQREARLIDLIQERLDQYSDAQVGAAARPCLAQCRSTLQRIFELRPLLDGQEGQAMELPADGSPLRYQWIGEATGQRRSGKLVHPGWEAARCELAQWTGEAADANIVAPAQLEP